MMKMRVFCPLCIAFLRDSYGFFRKQRLHRSMQKKDDRSPPPTPVTTLSTRQVADRMGLTTWQLQDLRLRGIGPPIVQLGL